MTTNPRIALLKKDFRLNRVPIFGGAALIFMPYLVSLIALLTVTTGLGQPKFRNAFAPCPEMSLILTGAMAAVFGGAAFAYERRERWADFLTMTPTPRIYSIISKSILSTLFLAPIWALNVFAAFKLIKIQTAIGHEFDLLIGSIGPLLMLFGVAWLISSFASSPSIAACTSIGLFMAAALLYNLICHAYAGPPPYADEANYDLIGCALCALIGVISFLAGSIYYLRRIEP